MDVWMGERIRRPTILRRYDPGAIGKLGGMGVASKKCIRPFWRTHTNYVNF